MSAQTSIETTVMSILSHVLNESAADLRAQPVLAAHEWDSLTSLEVLAQLENQLYVSLDLRRYHAARSIDDLVSLVGDAVAAKSATAH